MKKSRVDVYSLRFLDRKKIYHLTKHCNSVTMLIDMVNKNPNLLEVIKKAISTGNYIYTGHAQQRLQDREVTRQEVKQVLKNGFHEKKKDTYDEAYNEWNYAIKGKTIDKKSLRIVLSFDKKNMLIITVIDLDK